MYESHFGLSGPPFQLVPDPGFFFGSRGHSNALAFLRSAAHQGDGFLVVTGEIGAGKTTLVRTLLEGLDAKQALAATMVSTQLESGDLPLAILLAFGAPQAGETKAQLNASLEAFLIDLAGKGRRALLIVDEAQNLSLDLIEELRLLSNLQLGSSALLQVFLVGQPELRLQMQVKALEQLRQRVTASCHLGPMDANETRAYVEHRLRRVGWVDRPPIEAHAFGQIHQWTAGIPRRINRLCNRLLLATFLERKDTISAESVEQIARDLRSEIGESEDQPKMEESYVSGAQPMTRPSSTPLGDESATESRVLSDAANPGSLRSIAAMATGAGVPMDVQGAPVPESVAAATPESAQPVGALNLPAAEAAIPASSSNAPPSAPDAVELDDAVVEPDLVNAIRADPASSNDRAIPDALTAFASIPAYSLAQLAHSANQAPGSGIVPNGRPEELATSNAAVARTVSTSTSLLEDHVVEEDEDLEADLPVPTQAKSPAPPPGVVAAHEVSLSSPKVGLDSSTALQQRPAGPVPSVSASMAPPIRSELSNMPRAHGASGTMGVDIPLDLHASPSSPSLKVPTPQRPPDLPAALIRPGSAAETVMVSPPSAVKAILEPLLCLVDSPTDYIKARALGRVLSESPGLPSVLIVHTGSVASLEVGEEISGVMPQKTSDVHLDVNEHGGAASAALAITRFDAVLRVYRPKAILAMGTSDTLLTCALFAHKSGVPILRNDAGRRRAWSRPGEEMNAMLLERLADTSYISDLATYYTLYRSGISTDRVLQVGNLSDNVLHFAAQHTVHPAEILRRVGVPTDALTNPRGYALCTVQFESLRAAHDDAAELISMLTLVARELPIFWAANELTLQELKSIGKPAALKAANIEVAPSLRYLDSIDLLRGARCLLAGNAGHFLDEAVTLGVHSIVLGRGMVVPVNSTEALQLSTALGTDQLTTVLAELLASRAEPPEKPPFWDGATAVRIAAHLTDWLPLYGANKMRGKRVALTPSSAVPRPKHPDAAIESLGVTGP